MKTYLLFLLFLLVQCRFAMAQAVAAEEISVLRRTHNSLEAQPLIDRAIDNGQEAAVYTLCHYSIKYCLERIGDLQGAKKARLMKMILKDETLVLPKEKFTFAGSAATYQAGLQNLAVRRTYEALNKPVPSPQPVLSRTELDNLAAQLGTVAE